MAQDYLKKFRSTISTSQAHQIFRSLQQKQQEGEIRTVDELKKSLKTLTTELLEKKIKPTFKIFPALVGRDISSEQYNEMLARIQDDLETAFTEAENLYELLNIHSEIINRTALSMIERSLNTIEDDLSALEFLQHNSRGFSNTIFNTFREIGNIPTDKSELLFTDFRTGKALTSLCQVAAGERLSLGSLNESFISISGVRLLGSSTQSDLDATLVPDTISNLIDGRKDTFWVNPVLLNNVSSVVNVLELDLPGEVQVSFIEIDPAAPYPLTLTFITVLGSNGTITTLSSTEVELGKETVRINFSQVSAKKIYLHLKQENYREIQYKENTDNDLYASESKKWLPTTLSNDVVKAIPSDFYLTDVLNYSRSSSNNVLRHYEYIFALDNIRVGISDYDQTSIFVSDRKEINYPLSRLGLRTVEKRPFLNTSGQTNTETIFSYPVLSSTETAKYYLGSIEYWATVEYFDAQENFITRYSFPVLPLESNRIYHERLILTKQTGGTNLIPDSGSLQFYCLANTTDVLVYRNGTLLTYGTDWDWVSTSHSSGLSNETANSGTRMSRGIRIVNRTNYYDYYTVSYTPIFGNTNNYNTLSSGIIRIVDLVGDASVRLGKDGIVYLSHQKISREIAKSTVFLTIIMRRNSFNNTVSPLLEEFLLGLGEAGKPVA